MGWGLQVFERQEGKLAILDLNNIDFTWVAWKRMAMLCCSVPGVPLGPVMAGSYCQELEIGPMCRNSYTKLKLRQEMKIIST